VVVLSVVVLSVVVVLGVVVVVVGLVVVVGVVVVVVGLVVVVGVVVVVVGLVVVVGVVVVVVGLVVVVGVVVVVVGLVVVGVVVVVVGLVVAGVVPGVVAGEVAGVVGVEVVLDPPVVPGAASTDLAVTMAADAITKERAAGAAKPAIPRMRRTKLRLSGGNLSRKSSTDSAIVHFPLLSCRHTRNGRAFAVLRTISFLVPDRQWEKP